MPKRFISGLFGTLQRLKFTDFPRIIFVETYLRVLFGDFRKSEIVYKIEAVELRSGKFRSSAYSIFKRGGRRLRCGKKRTENY